jgi:hypothetical protein
MNKRSSCVNAVILEYLDIINPFNLLKLKNPVPVYFENLFYLCCIKIPKLFLMVIGLCDNFMLPPCVRICKECVCCFYFIVPFLLDSRKLVVEPADNPSAVLFYPSFFIWG